MKRDFLDRYEVHTVGASYHTEWWIPAEDLEQLNGAMIGPIEVIGEYRASQAGQDPHQSAL